MPSHWTYSDFSDGDDLQQGDLLRRTDDLLSVLSRVHQFFSDERYVAFAILTQSCDLVRRRGSCKTEHIQLAVIRELESLLPRILEERCGVGVSGVFTKESRYFAQQIMRKIVNQNDQARGLFYLHPETDAGIVTPSVIMLRISIALRREHYDLLCQARCGRLSAEYANKLGWLSGNLYSRIATPDWEDQEHDKDASAKLAKAYLNRITQPDGENWVPEAWVEAAKADGIVLAEIPAHEFATSIKKYAPPTSMDVILEQVKKVSQEVFKQQLAEATKVALAERGNLVDSFIEIVAKLVQKKVAEVQVQQFSERLRADDVFCQAIRNHAGSIFSRKT